jgi:hypothetical protein
LASRIDKLNENVAASQKFKQQSHSDGQTFHGMICFESYYEEAGTFGGE